MASRLLIASIAVVMVLATVAVSDAAAQRPPLPPEPERPAASRAATAADSLQQAQRLVRQGTYARGIALLEQLVRDYPGRLAFRYELIDAYEETKAYDEALALLNRTLSDPSVSDLATKGRLQHLAGRPDAARATWDEAIARYPQRASTYRSLYHTLTALRLFPTAIDVVQQGRDALDDPDAFQNELAYLYSLDGQYAASMREYVAMLDPNGRRLSFVQSRLQPFLDQSGELGDAVHVLEDAVAAHPDHTAYLNLLAWLHAEQNDYDAALSAYTRLDTLRNDQGRTVLGLARQAADAGDEDAARRALAAVRAQFPRTEAAQLADKIAGDMAYRRWKQAPAFSPAADTAAHEAWTAYRNAIASAQVRTDSTGSLPAAYASVWMRQAELALEVRNDLGTARRAHAALAQFRGYTTERMLLAGRIALRANDLPAARAHLDSLAQSDAQSAPHRAAQHLLALLDLHDGATERAQERLNALLGDFSHDTANDAVALQAAVRHFQGRDSTSTGLQSYAQGLVRERQHRWARADSAYADVIAQMPGQPLATRARYQRARLAARLQDPGAASTALQAFAAQFPQHPWADRALFEAAALLDHAQRNPSEARAVYMRLLETHPRSVFASSARLRVRALAAS